LPSCCVPATTTYAAADAVAFCLDGLRG